MPQIAIKPIASAIRQINLMLNSPQHQVTYITIATSAISPIATAVSHQIAEGSESNNDPCLKRIGRTEVLHINN